MKKNTKGMTLVEVIIAMCILGVLSAMFVTIAVRAKKENLYNLRRSNEMYEQAAFAESYNTDVKYGSNVKVVKLTTGSLTTDNKFTLSADFGTISLSTDAYGYMVTRRDKDKKDADYNLRFFRSEYGSIAEPPDPENGRYWVKIYNDSGSDIDYLFFAKPLVDGGRFYDDDGPIDNEKNEICTTMAAGSKREFGIIVGSTEPVFTISHNEDINTSSHVNDGEDQSFDSSTLENYFEEKDGKITGFIIMHICEDGTIRNQADFEEMGSKPADT